LLLFLLFVLLLLLPLFLFLLLLLPFAFCFFVVILRRRRRICCCRLPLLFGIGCPATNRPQRIEASATDARRSQAPMSDRQRHINHTQKPPTKRKGTRSRVPKKAAPKAPPLCSEQRRRTRSKAPSAVEGGEATEYCLCFAFAFFPPMPHPPRLPANPPTLRTVIFPPRRRRPKTPSIAHIVAFSPPDPPRNPSPTVLALINQR
jgi:hypothetical protein